MDAPPPIDAGSLLEHTAWVKRLARSLVADPNAADDLVQDTWLRALESPPRHAANPRGWLASVLRNALRQKERGEERRRGREEGVARMDVEPDTLDVVARAAMHQELAERVMALREPYRTTVLLRFFDELPPAEIAARLRIPVHTVSSRLQRGLAELRETLDRRHGGRSAWVTLLLPGAWHRAAPILPASPSLSASLGALVMNAKWTIPAVLVLALVGVLGVRAGLEGEPAVEPAPSSALAEPIEPRSDAPSEVLAAASGASEAERAVASPAEPASASVDAVTAAPARPALRGRVLDVSGEPLGGVRVAASGSRASVAPSGDAGAGSAVSDRFGEFEMPAPADAVELVVDQDGYATVMTGLYRPLASIEPVVVAARARSLAGRVTDDAGAPLAGALVRFELDGAFATRFSFVLDASREHRWSAVTAADGSFELTDAPRAAGASLRTSLQGYADDVREAPDFADPAIQIVLARAEVARRHVSGEVRSADGALVAGAHVALGPQALLTSADGTFDFDLERGDGERLIAVHAGSAPAELRASPTEPRWPAFVRLTLGGPPPSIAGRVVDARGDPLSGIRVWLANPSYFGEVDGVLTQVEHLLAGGRAPEWQPEAGDEHDAPNLLWTWFRTDAEGRFRIEGLYGGSYRIKAFDPRSLVWVEEGPFDAGASGVEIRFPDGADYERVEGRVVSPNGDPVANVKVSAVRHVIRVHAGTTSSAFGHGGAETTTDADGRFALERVARDGVFLAVSGDAILGTWLDLPEASAGGESTLTGLVIQATRRCHVQVELEGDRARADAFAVLDAAGERMSLALIRGDHEFSDRTAQLVDGRSPVLAVGEDAETLVLLSKGSEVERVPIRIGPERVNVLRP